MVKGMSLAMTKGLNLAIGLADQKRKTYAVGQYSNMDMTMDLYESTITSLIIEHPGIIEQGGKMDEN